MSIEQKIAELLAESKAAELATEVSEEVKLAGKEGGQDSGKDGAAPAEANHLTGGTNHPENEDNARNNVDNQDEAIDAVTKKANRATDSAAAPEASHLKASVKEDVDALINGEDLSEEFKTKAATIFEAAVVTRVKAEVSRLEEEYNAKLEESMAQYQEGLVEKVDGYLDYVVEQWIAQNEIALERGMKSEILEGFVSSLKGVFEEHYIDVPEEKFDVLGALEEQVEQLEAKLDEQLAANVELSKVLGEMKRNEIIGEISEGLTDTEVEKFKGLAEELSYEDAESFKSKVQTIRENYFSTKATAGVKSVVTDAPVDALTEEKKLDPAMSAYLNILNRK